MTFLEFYEPPFYTDGIFVWSNNGHMALMADDLDKDCEALLSRLCDILNGNIYPDKDPDLTYQAPNILLNGNLFLTIRGWGSLIADAGLTENAACEIQDNFANWVIEKLHGHDSPV